MKFLVALLLTTLLAFVAGLYMDWWSIALVAFLVAILVSQRPLRAFLAGFFAIFLLWGVLSFFINSANDGLLSTKIGQLLGLGPHPMLMVLLTAFIGGLVAGLAALSGSFVRVSK